VYHDVVIVIIPLHEPEATGQRSLLQVMELALARIGADEAVGADHLAPQSQPSDHQERSVTSRRPRSQNTSHRRLPFDLAHKAAERPLTRPPA
jgi:hypothetical protein